MWSSSTNWRRSARLAGLAAAATLSVAARASAAAPPRFEPAACPADFAGARCGVVRVPEAYDRPGGRQVALRVVIVPAQGPAGGVAQFDLEGGPGVAATNGAGYYLSETAGYRRGRDVVLIDQRGMGGSQPLRCPGLEGPRFAPAYPPRLVAACARDLSRRADLSQYVTANMVRDTEAVRRALGYRQVDLFGLSYGTTLALRYMATYPQSVRSAVLMGAVPAWTTPPSRHAPAATQALGLLWARCAEDTACHSAFPDPAGDLDRALARFSGGPISGLERDTFMEAIRGLLYAPSGARRVPYIVHRAAAGDLTPLTNRGGGGPPIADGPYLSITCAESFGHFEYQSAARASRETPFGDYRLRRQRAACAAWPHGVAGAGHFATVRVRVPVLLVSGGLDPVSPPAWAARLARELPNARQATAPAGGHLLEGLADADVCLDQVMVAFYRAATTKGLEASCLEALRFPPFQTGPEGV